MKPRAKTPTMQSTVKSNTRFDAETSPMKKKGAAPVREAVTTEQRNIEKPAPKAPAKTPAQPTNEQISQRAHEIWEREGRPEGRHVEHWLTAEAELRSKSQ